MREHAPAGSGILSFGKQVFWHTKSKERYESMLFAATFKVKDGESAPLAGFIARRTQSTGIGNAPTEGRFAGIDIVGEYWLQSTDPRIILIFEADENGPILELASEWESHFDINIVPAVNVADVMTS